MSLKLYSTIITKLKTQTTRTIGIIDFSGKIILSSKVSLEGTRIPNIEEKINNEICLFEGNTYKKLTNKEDSEIFFISGEDEISRSICGIAAICLSSLKSIYNEKYDKATFLKNILLDNILTGDICARARELHFNADSSYIVFLCRDKNTFKTSILETLTVNCNKDDFCVHIKDGQIVFLKALPQKSTKEYIDKQIKEVMKILSGFENIVTGVGAIAERLQDISKSFKEAKLAIEVGTIFDSSASLIKFDELGIGRLIYQLPKSLCTMFIEEVLGTSTMDNLDEEILYTVKRFFENNLNVSETSRKLFVHRNTLVYRLEKIKKLTGLDIREFDDAIVFKLALMVKRYLDSRL